MKARLNSFYEFFAGRKAHASVIYFAAATILLVSIGGVVSSTIIGLLIALGILTLILDKTTQEALLNHKKLMPLTFLLIFVLVWQGIGLFLRGPSGGTPAGSVLVSALGIAMLLPLLHAASQHDPSFRDRMLEVLFALGSIAAVLSLGRYFVMLAQTGYLSAEGLLKLRLVPVGRANHQILGAGGLAACLFAGFALYPQASPYRRRWMWAGFGFIALAIMLTQSRGPILSLGLACIAAYVFEKLRDPALRAPAGLTLAVLCFALPVAMILAEPWIKSLTCTTDSILCRSSYRQNVWFIVFDMIWDRPWLGIGPGFRFPDAMISHPHNGLLGLVFYFGLPMALLFIGIVAFAIVRTALAPPSPSRTFASLGIFFSLSFIATDLSNPFAFVNTLYIYLWLPVFLGSILDSCPKEDLQLRCDLQPARDLGSVSGR
ncbi:O-antigen ligase [Microvirga flocculans]|uniref:O-antigen ligase n=1 Tax=Microvirga flocculans TaxID=217168 RepID=A0A7W6IEJ4_9HYPH|nr:O-antigen ligase family protein [Microvirga flocculans]MBB4039701.1 O-antigen ligase [Microvirga flocculans]